MTGSAGSEFASNIPSCGRVQHPQIAGGGVKTPQTARNGRTYLVSALLENGGTGSSPYRTPGIYNEGPIHAS